MHPLRLFIDSEEEQIAKIYLAGHSPEKIRLSYGVSRKVITNAIKRQNIKRRPNRTHFFNQYFFDDLNKEESLYVLGFAYADGNVTKNELRFGLSIKDIEQLVLFKKLFNSTAKIGTWNNYSCSISFCSTCMAAKLKELGIVVNRGNFYKLKPHLPEDLIQHFIRDYLDGDGCISTNEQVVFLGKPDILKFIRSTLHTKAGANLNNIRPRRGTSEVSWGGFNQANKIINWLYQDATIWLSRKRKIAENWRK